MHRRDCRGPSLGLGCARTDHSCHLVRSKDTVALSHRGWRVTDRNQVPSWVDPEAKSFLHCGDKNILPVTVTSATQDSPCQLHTWVLSSHVPAWECWAVGICSCSLTIQCPGPPFAFTQKGPSLPLSLCRRDACSSPRPLSCRVQLPGAPAHQS